MKRRLSSNLTLDGTTYPKIDTDSIAGGHASVDVLLDDNGEEFKTMMTAGIVASRVSNSNDTRLSQDGTKDVVAPVTGWWIFIKKEESRRDEGPRGSLEASS